MKGFFRFGSLAILSLVGGAVAASLSWRWLNAPDSTTVPNSETLRNVGLLIGGLLAFVFAGWRAGVAEQQANAAQHQAETSQQSLLNERYQRGTQMLGSAVLAVRIGGIRLKRGHIRWTTT